MDSYRGGNSVRSFCPSSERDLLQKKGCFHKERKFFPFRIDPFSKRLRVQENEQESTKVVSLVNNQRHYVDAFSMTYDIRVVRPGSRLFASTINRPLENLHFARVKRKCVFKADANSKDQNQLAKLHYICHNVRKRTF